MVEFKKEVLLQLPKEHLVYLIDKLEHSLAIIGEICVEESKQHIDSSDAVDEIRENIYQMPNLYKVDETKAFIDMKMGKITPEKYRKLMGFD